MNVWKPSLEEIEKTKSWDIWNKEQSEFSWQYEERETCYILEGEAEVIDKRGNRVTFKSGDMVQFDEGLVCTWKIKKEIRKRYYFG